MRKRPAVSKQRPSRIPKNYCFGCGKDNPDSMRLKFKFEEERGCVVGQVRLSRRYTGPPGYCHGGIIATVLDEVMAKLNKLHGVTAVTSEMTVNYLRPVPLNQTLRLEAQEMKVEGRRRTRSGEILNKDGVVLAHAKGIFITVDPERVFASL